MKGPEVSDGLGGQLEVHLWTTQATSLLRADVPHHSWWDRLIFRTLPVSRRPLEKATCTNRNWCGQEECARSDLTGEFVDRSHYFFVPRTWHTIAEKYVYNRLLRRMSTTDPCLQHLPRSRGRSRHPHDWLFSPTRHALPGNCILLGDLVTSQRLWK